MAFKLFYYKFYYFLVQPTSQLIQNPILELSLFCLHKCYKSKLVSCLTLWKTVISACRQKVFETQNLEWGNLQQDINIWHYFIHFITNIMIKIDYISNDLDYFGKGFYRFYQAVLMFYDRPPINQEFIKNFIISNYIKPNIINSTTLNTKGFLYLIFLKDCYRCEFFIFLKFFMENQLYCLPDFSNNLYIHMAIITLLTQYFDLIITSKKDNKIINDSINFSFNIVLEYCLVLLHKCDTFHKALYPKLIRCINLVFSFDIQLFESSLLPFNQVILVLYYIYFLVYSYFLSK